jgi:hypothetical protein
MEEAAAKVQEEITAAYEEAERARNCSGMKARTKGKGWGRGKNPDPHEEARAKARASSSH